MMAPRGVEASPPLKAHLIGTSRAEVNDFSAVEEVVQEIEVALPPSPDAGPKSGEVRPWWDSRGPETLPITWTVKPMVNVIPAGVTIKPGVDHVQHKVHLIATDQPVRILNVAGPLLAKTYAGATEARRSHLIDLEIDPSRYPSFGVSDVVIETDHPDQPYVTLSVLGRF